jgi:uncharacterized protein YjbJ (UPF0337 family)
MSDIVDKISGKTKQAVGDVVGDRSLHREGRKEERKGDAKEEAARAQDKAEAKAREVANLERETNEARPQDRAQRGTRPRGHRARVPLS